MSASFSYHVPSPPDTFAVDTIVSADSGATLTRTLHGMSTAYIFGQLSSKWVL